MVPKGIENADTIIAACRLALSGLDAMEPESKEILQSVIEILEDMKPKFFLKTNLAIPATNAPRKDAEELRSLVEKHDLARFPEVLARLQSSMEELLKQAKMEGIIIT